MAGRGKYSSYSSPSPSPDPFADHYDPFDPPLDPIEMSNLSGPSHDRDISLHNVPTGAYYPGTTPGDGAGGQYEPVPARGVSRSPTYQTTIEPSMTTVGSGLVSYKTKDAAAQELVDRRAGELAQWRIHWSTPAIIISLFVAGVMGAVGHHLFYSRLDGEAASNQLKMIRYGTALAFFTKSTLVGTVILSYRQRIWHTFRNKAMTVHAIDGLFSATEDLTQFMVWEMVRSAKVATFMAACSWLIPIASVLSPASLTSEGRTTYNQTTCPSVASLNFTHESLYNFRKEGEFPGSSLAYYNTTDGAGGDGYFDYYDQPSKNAKRLTVTSVYLQKPAMYPNASLNSCGEGYNCEYSITFTGPGYKCDEVANSSNPNTENIIANGAPFNISALAPQGEYVYLGVTDIGDYASPQVPTKDNGEPQEGPPYPEMLGVFQIEPVLWIGFSRNTTTPYDPNSAQGKKWKNVHEPKIIQCVAHHTEYRFIIKFNETIQQATRVSRIFVSPVVDTTVTLNPANKSDLTITPAENFVRPNTDPEKYKLTAAYHSMGSLLRTFLRGGIVYGAPFVTKSDISETRLIEPSTSYPVANLTDEIQSLYEDMLITLLSEPHLVIASKDSVPCTKSRTQNVYIYHPQGLWIGYAIAVAVTFAFMLVGFYSIWQNGVSSDTQFSRIMVTTRNPTIDRLSVGACLGGDPFPRELRETKLRFGVLLEDEDGLREGPLGRVEHCCFGTTGETKAIVKYGTYAGLKRWREDEELGAEDEKEALLLEKSESESEDDDS
ncbi:hypothetical protein BCR34DRAFT_475712 [Clohesyomyces aquaticus]|uniref:Uncharacterized protein n=1 Tax=Clohesyomyces aquaticus TaxID=1231657 RepID=A0A1Y2A2P2_9PLEO|nr:hypothetical protein BCR34DRAFT_475712 [Clohesyomyces aquaticus]